MKHHTPMQGSSANNPPDNNPPQGTTQQQQKDIATKQHNFETEISQKISRAFGVHGNRQSGARNIAPASGLTTGI